MSGPVPPPAAGPLLPDDSAPLSLEKTPAHGIATVELMKRKIAEAATASAESAARGTWKAGWLAGIGSAVVITVAAFGVWFKSEASAQEKADKAEAAAIAAADAGTDRKLLPLITDVAVMKNDVADLKAAAKTQADKQDEVLRLLRRRDK